MVPTNDTGLLGINGEGVVRSNSLFRRQLLHSSGRDCVARACAVLKSYIHRHVSVQLEIFGALPCYAVSNRAKRVVQSGLIGVNS